MPIINQKNWNHQVKINDDPYGGFCGQGTATVDRARTLHHIFASGCKSPGASQSGQLLRPVDANASVWSTARGD